jgi:hypothetical protein
VSRRVDLLVAGLSLALTLWLTGGMWLDPDGRTILVNSGDQALFEWLLSYAGYTLHSGADPFFTHLLNVPDGANIAVNTSATLFGWVFAPVTWLAGPPVAFLVILTLNLVATAYAWYWLLSRHLGASPGAAAFGGLFCGFAPALVSHANAHLNWSAQWLMVLIVWAVLRLRVPGAPWRKGLVLGLLVAAGFSIAAEALFFTALACGVFVAVWAPSRRTQARAVAGPFIRGLAVGAGVAFVLLAYPLWMHFFGPLRYQGIGFDQRVHSEDLLAFGAYPARSLAGLAGLDTRLAPNPTEETTFFGVPLLLLAVAGFVLLWRASAADPGRRAVLRALGVTALVFAVLALGPRLKLGGDITDLRLPYVLLAHLPMFDAALPARLALVVTPIVGILLTWTVDLARSWTARGRRLLAAALVIALLPLAPIPLLTTPRRPVPEFISSGQWRSYVPEGGTIVPVPLPSDLLPDGQRWQAAVMAEPGEPVFAIPAGFFLGPGPDGRSQIGPIPRPTHALLFAVAKNGRVPRVGEAQRAQAREDLRYWHASVVVLADQVHGSKWPVHYDAVLRTATALFGPPERVSDIWLWRVDG